MASVNKVILIGNLGRDPETRYMPDGGAITNVSVATTDKWKDKNGEMQEKTEWHRVAFFGKLAEIAGEYLKKGRQVYVEGSIRTDKYTGQDGVEKFSTEIVANEMQMLGGGGERGEGASYGGGAGGSRERAPRGAPAGAGAVNERSGGAPRNAPAADDFQDDDIPF